MAQKLKCVKETKSLGIIVDEGLNWNEQYRKVKGKVSGGLWSLKKLMKIVLQSQLVNIYHALVESHLICKWCMGVCLQHKIRSP